MKLTGCADNLERAFNRADPIDYAAGLSSYKKYHHLMRTLADLYDCTVEEATAVFVATSPNNDYLNNLRSTVSLLAGRRDGIPVERITISTYNHCRTRAWSYLHGVDFLNSAKGPKIRSFYRNIVDPLDAFPVTIDGHMVGAWTGKRIPMKEAAINGFKYETAADDTRHVARQYGLLPNQLQAIIWFTWKRVHNVVYSGNLDIFGDHWGLDIDVRGVRAFAVK